MFPEDVGAVMAGGNRRGKKCVEPAHETCEQVEQTMLMWALAFFVLALAAGFLGLFALAGLAAAIAKLLFLVFVVLVVVSLLSKRDVDVKDNLLEHE